MSRREYWNSYFSIFHCLVIENVLYWSVESNFFSSIKVLLPAVNNSILLKNANISGNLKTFRSHFSEVAKSSSALLVSIPPWELPIQMKTSGCWILKYSQYFDLCWRNVYKTSFFVEILEHHCSIIILNFYIIRCFFWWKRIIYCLLILVSLPP